YRGVTLWMLNDKLEQSEIVRQLDGFSEAGWGGLIGRTFNGLRTEYLSDEWMEIIQAIITRAGQLGMKVWLQAGYMPSAIPDLDPADVGLGLAMRGKDEPGPEGEVVLAEDDRYAYCERSLGYVLDLLNGEAVTDYLDLAYRKPWYSRFPGEFGRTIEAVWVDEPHFRPPLLPWCERLAETFREQWGYEIREHLGSLFHPLGDYMKVRHHYWRTVLGMFLEAYFVPVGRWCAEHDVKFAGHLMGEDTLNSQIAWTGAAMPCYEYMQLPGIDHLTMSLYWPTNKKFILTPKQVSSAANQLGIADVLCEVYAVSSQGITFEDRKQIAQWMAVLGINYRCYHGSFYSLRGRRKRIYVPHLSYQQPWWPDNRPMADYFARLSYALRCGWTRAEVLVLHPVESAMCLYDPTSMGRPHDRSTEAADVKAMDDRLVQLCDNLLKIHRGWEFGDETLMAKYGKVAADGLAVGRMTYRVVVLPEMLTMRRTTVELLREFVASGGTILSVGELPTRIDGAEDGGLDELLRKVQPVANHPAALAEALKAAVAPEIEVTATTGDPQNVLVQARQVDQGRLYYLINTSRRETVEARVRIRGAGTVQYWNLAAGNVQPVAQDRDGEFVVVDLSFAPVGAHLLLLTEGPDAAEVPAERLAVKRTVELAERLSFKRHEPNAMTLDICRLKTDGGDFGDPIPVLAVQQKLNDQQYSGPVTLQFGFNVETPPENLSVVVEDAANYRIAVNGKEVQYAGAAYYVDRSFHLVDITALVRQGRNIIELSIDFQPTPKSKFSLASLFENKAGTELESIYLVGDFALVGKVSSSEAGLHSLPARLPPGRREGEHLGRPVGGGLSVLCRANLTPGQGATRQAVGGPAGCSGTSHPGRGPGQGPRQRRRRWRNPLAALRGRHHRTCYRRRERDRDRAYRFASQPSRPAPSLDRRARQLLANGLGLQPGP
ncbi:MAG: hypothetical protein GWP05_04630, partial [Anaerolineaceae bacterium]|nr:hypothetical protein [Anaerolineaceae bacterium]